ncbi:MAG: nicotinate (nicotinamide) nucleotide adenylyltransferase [Burkholderiaceae bacterium]
MTAPRRLGLYGGTFDPPHNAHLALAAAALQQLKLDELRILPTGQAWHKARQPSPAAQRLAMTELAFAGLPRVVVDDREIRRSGPTYTIDTLLELKAEFPEARMVLVMGADQASALPSWHRWREILQVAVIAVAGRTQPGQGSRAFDLESLPDTGIQRLQMPLQPISATTVRERAARSERIDHLVPAAVARYIEQNFLYRTA